MEKSLLGGYCKQRRQPQRAFSKMWTMMTVMMSKKISAEMEQGQKELLSRESVARVGLVPLCSSAVAGGARGSPRDAPRADRARPAPPRQPMIPPTAPAHNPASQRDAQMPQHALASHTQGILRWRLGGCSPRLGPELSCAEAERALRPRAGYAPYIHALALS